MGLSRAEFRNTLARQNWYSYGCSCWRSLWCCYLLRQTCDPSIQGRRRMSLWWSWNRTKRASSAFRYSTRWLPWLCRRLCAQFTRSNPVQQDGPNVSNYSKGCQLINVPRLNLWAERSCRKSHHYLRAKKNKSFWRYYCLWHDREGALKHKRSRAIDKSAQYEDASRLARITGNV